MIKLLVSIVNYNSYQDTAKVIKSILKGIYLDGFEVNFVVVDNSSHQTELLSTLDNLSQSVGFNHVCSTDEMIPNQNFWIESENKGFGAANNIVLDFVENTNFYDVIWILNNDLTLDLNCLVSLKKYLIDDDFAILGSTIIEDDHILVGTDNMDSFKGYGQPSPVKIQKDVYPVDAVIGTSMFLKRKFLNGFRFDESFFMYVEENDLCYRFKKAGYYSYVVKSSKVYHESGKTFGDRQALRWYYKVRNLLYFKSKNGSKNLLLVPYLFFSTLKQYKFSKPYWSSYFCGVFDYWNGRFGKSGREF